MEGLHCKLSPLVHASSIPAKAVMTAAKQTCGEFCSCRQYGHCGLRMAYPLHSNTILFICVYVFRYLYHRILVLICCYILAPGFTAAQLRASFAVVQFSRQMFLSCCALSYGVLSMLQVGIGPPPSSPDQVRAGSNLWLEGKRLGKGPQDGGWASMYAG